MGALTKKERDGLEDVFLSIHSNNNKHKKLRDYSSLLLRHEYSIAIEKLYKRAVYGVKETKFSQFLAHFAKTKKNLSK